ncbi:MAG: DciA family protein [Victivallaceae bacterium]|nr:DciA family protein [Victivallaceae bacterium]
MTPEEENAESAKPPLYAPPKARRGGLSLRKRGERYAMLKDWYGKEYANTEISAHTAKAVSVAELIENQCAEAMGGQTAVWLEISTHWLSIAGAQFARLATPAGLDGGTLLLEVRHPLIIRELAGSTDLILDRVRSCVKGGRVCTEIKLVPSGRGRR